MFGSHTTQKYGQLYQLLHPQNWSRVLGTLFSGWTHAQWLSPLPFSQSQQFLREAQELCPNSGRREGKAIHSLGHLTTHSLYFPAPQLSLRQLACTGLNWPLLLPLNVFMILSDQIQCPPPSTLPFSIYISSLKLLSQVLLRNASSQAQCTVRPNRLKCQSLEQRKIQCRAIQGDRQIMPPSPNSLKGFNKAFLKAW